MRYSFKWPPVVSSGVAAILRGSFERDHRHGGPKAGSAKAARAKRVAEATRPVARVDAAPRPRRPHAGLWIGLTGALVAIVVAVLVVTWPGGPEATQAAGDGEPGLVTKVELLYNDIYLYQRPDGYYVLSFGAKRLHYIELIVNPNDETRASGLLHPVDDRRRWPTPPTRRCATMIGLGGGRTAWYPHKSIPTLHDHGGRAGSRRGRPDRRDATSTSGATSRTSAVEVRDGRVYPHRDRPETFDMIFVDAYRGPFVPFHLLTREFFELARRHLEPGGVVAQNIEPTTMLFDSAVATIGSVFAHLDFFEGGGNIVILAYDGPQKDQATIEKLAAEREAQFGLRYPLAQVLTAGSRRNGTGPPSR